MRNALKTIAVVVTLAGLASCGGTHVQTTKASTDELNAKKILVIGVLGDESSGDTNSFDAIIRKSLTTCGIDEVGMYRIVASKDKTLSLDDDDKHEQKVFHAAVMDKKKSYQPDALLEILKSSYAQNSGLGLKDGAASANYRITLVAVPSNKVIWSAKAVARDDLSDDARINFAEEITKRLKEANVLKSCPQTTDGEQ